jgi:Xaa-Pro aminopeptidase
MTGSRLDILARRHLWAEGLNYNHGTGHGVGYFGGVHEDPVGISRNSKVEMVPNMVVTNEPGFYEAGKFGIRIENQLVVVKDKEGMHTFENMTLCPYDRALI